MKTNTKKNLLEYTKEFSNLEIPRIVNLDSLLKIFNNTCGDQNKFYLNCTFIANINSKENFTKINNLQDSKHIIKKNINIFLYKKNIHKYWKYLVDIIYLFTKDYEIISNSLNKNQNPIDNCYINWGKNWNINYQNNANTNNSKDKVKSHTSNEENIKINLIGSIKWSNYSCNDSFYDHGEKLFKS